MEEQELKPFYDYDVKEAYSKINSLLGKVVMFKETTDYYPYTATRIEKAKITKILNSDGYAINIAIRAPIIESKKKLTPEQIFNIIYLYDRKCVEERQNVINNSNSTHKIINKVMEYNEKKEEIKKLPKMNFLKKRKMKKEARSNLVSEVMPSILENLKPLKITQPEDIPPLSISYTGWDSRRVSSKEMVDTMEAVIV